MTDRLDAKAIATELGKCRPQTNYFSCCCPAHNDRNPSFIIGDKGDGSIWFKCLAGCPPERIRNALETRNLWPSSASLPVAADHGPRKADEQKYTILSPVPPNLPHVFVGQVITGEIHHFYEYWDGNDQLLMVVTRTDDATGKRIHPNVFAEFEDGTRSWVRAALPKPWPLYRLDLLERRPDAPVLVVEGEKTADAAFTRTRDYVAISWPGGAQAVENVDWKPLRGRDVVLWPDADAPGRKAMEKISKLVTAAGAARVRCVELPTCLPEGWDLADELPEGVDPQQIILSATEVGGGLRRHIRSARSISELNLPPKEFLIDHWLPKAGLAMVWAARGVGKTWFSLELALCVAEGADFLSYHVQRAETVLFIDGEMPLIDAKERFNQLRATLPEKLHFLSSELLFANDTPLNINDEADQQRILDAIEELSREGNRPSLIVLDNLSSLTSGLDENDNSALDRVLKFLLRLRHAGISVLLVHHANKTGDQRGASRREDLLDTSIRLSVPPKDQMSTHTGGHFVMEFTKTRGRAPQPSKLEVKLVSKSDGRIGLSWNNEQALSPLDQILRLIAKERPKKQTAIGEKLGRAKGTISRDMEKLEKRGLITRAPIELTQAGRQRALELWPDLHDILAQQDNIPF